MRRKTNSSIGKISDIPRLRLKALRKLIKITQVQLAARCGMSYPYILAVETGRLRLTPQLAEAISCATGIDPNWLLGEGSASKPITPFGMPYTRDYFIMNFDRRYVKRGDISERRLAEIRHLDLDGDESREIHGRCHELTQFMLTAYRKRRFPLALYFFRKMSNETTERLQLGRIQTDEHLDRLEKALHGPLMKGSSLWAEFDLDTLWRLVSPTACLKWAEAWASGDKEKQNDLLQQLDNLKELVERSFDLQK